MRQIEKAVNIGLILMGIAALINFVIFTKGCGFDCAIFQLGEIIGGLISIYYGFREIEEKGLLYIAGGTVAVFLGFILYDCGC